MTARTLVLLRHAKAETPDALPDFDRPLTADGRRDADAAGAWLAGERLHPDLVLCSPAVRTRQTWQGVSSALTGRGGDTPDVRWPDGLYAGGPTEVFDLLRGVPDTVGTVLVIGHNPTMSDVSTLLLPDDQYDGKDVAFKTAGLAVHRTDGSWSTTERGSMRLVAQHTARG